MKLNRRAVKFVTATPDLSHVLFQSSVPLAGGQPANGSTYDYEWSSGELQLIDELPAGTPVESNNVEVFIGATEHGDQRHAVSADGSRVFWGTYGGTHAAELYMRDVPREETIKIEAPANGQEFQDASADGSMVFFTSGFGATSGLRMEEVENGKVTVLTVVTARR